MHRRTFILGTLVFLLPSLNWMKTKQPRIRIVDGWLLKEEDL